MQSSLDELRLQIQQAEPVLKRLDVEMERIEFDPQLPASVAAANAAVTRLIETLLAGFEKNPILAPLAKDLEAQYLDGILVRVNDAKRKARLAGVETA